MSKCPFYQLHSQQPAEGSLHPITWCSHTQSPVSFVIATETVGPSEKLTCGGELAKCQIPIELRPPSWLA
jgi:hypothetical protein